MGNLLFWEFKSKDGIQKIKSWEQESKNKESVKQVLYRYFNLFVFPFNQNTSFHPQSIANCFLTMYQFAQVFLDHYIPSPILNAKSKRVGSHACKFHCVGDVHSPADISIMFCYSSVPLISSPISQRFGVTPRQITLCSKRTC